MNKRQNSVKEYVKSDRNIQLWSNFFQQIINSRGGIMLFLIFRHIYIMSQCRIFMLKEADMSNNEVNVCSRKQQLQTALNVKFPTVFSTFSPS